MPYERSIVAMPYLFLGSVAECSADQGVYEMSSEGLEARRGELFARSMACGDWVVAAGSVVA